MTVSVKKSAVERYTLKSRDPHWWADITISSDGFLNIQSDYGNFAYAWGSFGDDFKAFLLDLDNSYLAGKIGRDHPDEFDSEATEKAIKENLIDMRKTNQITQKEARYAWDEFNMCGLDSEESLYRDYPLIHKYVYENDLSAIPCIKNTAYAVTAFLERCWPAFKEELKKEHN